VPELPEVETFTRYFARHALGQTIERVEVRDERILTLRRDTFVRKLKGQQFHSVRRHGKHLFAEATPSLWLHLHFGMSGDLGYYREPADEPRFARVIFSFDNGAKLAFEDMRLFGLAELLGSPDAYIEAKGLGPDPLDPAFTFRRFDTLLLKRKGAIKSLLMTQEILAGLGNLYVDETLFATSLHPRRGVDTLAPAERKAVFTAIRRILRDAIRRNERGADWAPKSLTKHREEGARCPLCGGSIERTVVFGRTTYFCAKHQR
jgi:formamidopyrimidine-DNA glycosylase